jgi:hypothetical protein
VDSSVTETQWLVLVKTVVNLRVPYKAVNFMSNWATICFSRNYLLHGIILHIPRQKITFCYTTVELHYYINHKSLTPP